MAYGDTIHVPQTRLPTLIRKARSHPSYKNIYKTMDDWEVYQHLQENFPQYDMDEAPEEWRITHNRQLLEEEQTSKIPKWEENPMSMTERLGEREPLEDIDDTKGATGGLLKKGYFTGAGLVHLLPPGIKRAWQEGANQSITGLAAHIATGEAPFTFDDEDDYDPTVLDNAIATASSFLYDWYMFVNPLTAGSAGAVKLASASAKKAASERLSKYYFGKLLEENVKKKSVTLGLETLKHKHIRKAMAGTMDIYGAKTAIKSINGVSKEVVNSLADDAARFGSAAVEQYVGSPQWMKKGLVWNRKVAKSKDKFFDELLPKPTLTHLISSYGTMSGKALGVYSGIMDAEAQMVQSLYKKYGEEAPNILQRWKETGEWEEFFDIDPTQVLYSATHGYIGGFVAGGLAGVRAAGAAGAFKKGNYNKWYGKDHAVLKDKMYQGWKANVGWFGAEALGFTVAGKVLDVGAKAAGMDIPEHSFGEELLQNVVTIGAIKSMHRGMRELKTRASEPAQELKAFYRKKSLEIMDRAKKMKAGLKEDNAYEKDRMKDIDELTKEQIEHNDKQEVRITLAEEYIIKSWENRDKLTRSDLDELEQHIKNLDAAREEIDGDSSGRRHRGRLDSALSNIKKTIGDYRKFFKTANNIEILKKERQALYDQRGTKTQDAIDRALKDDPDFIDKGKFADDIINKAKDIHRAHKEGKITTKQKDEQMKELLSYDDADAIDPDFVTKKQLDDKVDKEIPQSDVDNSQILKKLDIITKKMDAHERKLEKLGVSENAAGPKTMQDIKDTLKNPDVSLDSKKVLLQTKKGMEGKSDETRIKNTELAATILEQVDIAKKLTSKQDKAGVGKSLRDLAYIMDTFHGGKTLDGLTLKIMSDYLQGKYVERMKGVRSANGRDVLVRENQPADVPYAKKKKSHLNSIIDAINSNLAVFGRSLNQKIATLEWTTEGGKKPAKGVSRPDVPPKELKSTGKVLIEKIKSGIKKFFTGKRSKEAIKEGKADKRTKTIDENVAQVIHHIQWAWGKRTVALARTEDGKTSALEGTGGAQETIRMKDIDFGDKGRFIGYEEGTRKKIYRSEDAPWKGKRVSIFLIDKGQYAVRDNPTELFEVVIYNEKTTFGYNPYQAVKKVWEKRIAHYDKDSTDAFLTTRGGRKEKTDKWGDYELMDSDVRGFAQDSLLPEGSSPHKVRHSWTELGRGVKDSVGRDGEWVAEFIDKFMLAHKGVTIEEVARPMSEFYGTEQTAARNAAKHKLVMKLLDIYLEKGANGIKASWKKLHRDAQTEFAKREGGEKLFVNPDKPSTVTGQYQHRGISEHRVATSKELTNHVLDQLSKNRGLNVNILKNKDYAGRFIDGVIEVVEGKATLDTFFHENVHRLELFARDSNDKRLISLWERGEKTIGEWARKNDPDGWAEYVRLYKNQKGTSPEKEYLTQKSADWSLEKSQATGVSSRMRIWFQQFFSRLKTMLGFYGPKDVAKIFGDIAEKGFSTEGMKLKGMRFQKVSKSEIISEEEKALFDDKLREFGAISQEEKLTFYNLLSDKLNMEYIPSPEHMTIAEFDRAMRYMDTIHMTPKGVRRKESWRSLNVQAHIWRDMTGWTDVLSEQLAKKLGVLGDKGEPSGSLADATEGQIKRYIQFLKDVGRRDWGSPDEEMQDAEFARNLAIKDKFWNSVTTKFGRLAFPVGYVLEKIGAKGIADRLYEHHRYENIMRGEGAYRVGNAIKLIGRKPLNKYMSYVLDPELQIGRDLDPAAKRFIRTAKEDRNSNEFKAHKEMRAMYDFYWKSLLANAKANITNPRELEKWMKANSKKYVENYFTRMLTKEAKTYFNIGKNFNKLVGIRIDSLVDGIMSDRNIKIERMQKKIEKLKTNAAKKPYEREILRLEREKEKIFKAANDKGGATYELLRRRAEEDVDNERHKTRNTVTNVYLLERKPRFDNIMKDDKGNDFKVYETDFEKVSGQYIGTMSNYLATTSIFPTYTNLRVKFSGDTVAGEKLSVLSKKGGEAGAYLELAVRRRIGLEPVDYSKETWNEISNKLGQYTATFGLSSPTSGIKNAIIGTAMGIGVLGFRNYMRSIARMMSPSSEVNNIKDYLQRLGAEQEGTKELELTGRREWWMRKVSWMKPSERWNRQISAWGGMLTAEQLVSRLRGEAWTAFGRTSAEKARRKLKEMFHLTEEEVMFLQNHGFKKGDYTVEQAPATGADRVNTRIQEIRDKVSHYSHIITQGATAEPFLPLWWQNRTAKSLTLFYRMAYSGTHNVFKYIGKPMKDGNFLPAARYIFAGNVLGGTLWSLYDAVLGSAPPKKNEEFEEVLLMNLAKAETLGLLSFVFSPYTNSWQEKLQSDSIMQPAIIRNSLNMMSLFYNGALALTGDDRVNAPELIRTKLVGMATVATHSLKLAENITNPYKTQMRKVKTYRKAFLKYTGLFDKEHMSDVYDPKNNPNAQYYKLVREAFYNNDLKLAARYYWATRMYLYDSYRSFQGKQNWYVGQANAMVSSRMKQLIRGMNPLEFPDPRGKRDFSKRKEFLNYLSSESKAIALDTEKTYYYRKRQLKKEVDKLSKEYNDLWDSGYMVDALPLPPSINIAGLVKFDTPGGWFKVKTKTSKIKKHVPNEWD